MNTDKLVSVCAMITAIVAVVIGVFELQTTREHQRLSVEPYLDLGVTNHPEFSLKLINSGLGPARLVSFNVKMDGQSKNNWNEITHPLANV